MINYTISTPGTPSLPYHLHLYLTSAHTHIPNTTPSLPYHLPLYLTSAHTHIPNTTPSLPYYLPLYLTSAHTHTQHNCTATLVFPEQKKLALGPLFRLGIGCMPEGVVRIILECNTSSRTPLGMFLAKILHNNGINSNRTSSMLIIPQNNKQH